MSIATSQTNAVWRARPSAVMRALVSQGYVLATVTGVPAIFAIFENDILLLAALLIPALVFIGIGMLSTRIPPPSDLRNIEAICTVSAVFIIITLAALPAFMVLGMPFIDALFEASSGTTSTGLTVTSNLSNWPLSGHVLRGWLQWVGGFAIALAGVATIIGPRSAVKKIGDSEVSQHDILSSTRLQARNLLKVYCIITAVSFAILVLVLPSWWEAFVISLSAVSTGGFTPRADSLASYSSTAQVLVMLICLSTTVSMIFYVLIFRSGLKKAIRRTNLKSVLITSFCGSLVILTLLLISTEFTETALLNSWLNFLSGFTTAGFSVSPVTEIPVVTPVILVIMVIGGGIGSTAGGIKVDRLVILLKILQISINKMRTPPHAVLKLKEFGQWMTQERIVSLVAVLTCYALTLMICWIIFLASGQPAFKSLFEIVSALSTVGLSTGITGPEMPTHLKFVLICAMLLGRLEFLALIVALSPITWHRRS